LIFNTMSETSSLQYPIQLSADDILGFLPHRPPMLFIRQATVLAADSFEGTAHWAADNPILAGHFPGCPIVPGAIILEAAAQLAGIGLLAGDPVTRNIEPGHVGMLGAVRKCSFKRPVLPGEDLRITLTCRRMAEKAVLASGTADVGGVEAAALEFMVVYAPESSLLEFISPDSLAKLFRK
jgi:3-hydroxyacyl-[acyl-carrier-protein] dehydratase